MALSMDASA